MDNGVIQSIAGIASQIFLTRKHIAHGIYITALAVSIYARLLIALLDNWQRIYILVWHTREIYIEALKRFPVMLKRLQINSGKNRNSAHRTDCIPAIFRTIAFCIDSFSWRIYWSVDETYCYKYANAIKSFVLCMRRVC